MSNKVLAESINAFPFEPEEQDLLGIVQDLKAEVSQLKGIIANLEAKVRALEATQDSQAENELNMLRLINDLRKKEPGKTEISRTEKIAKYLQSRPDHKASFETLRGHLGIDKVLLSQAVKVLIASSPRQYTTIKIKGNKRILVMLPSS